MVLIKNSLDDERYNMQNHTHQNLAQTDEGLRVVKIVDIAVINAPDESTSHQRHEHSLRSEAGEEHVAPAVQKTYDFLEDLALFKGAQQL